MALTAAPAIAAPPSIWEQAANAALQCVPFAREVSGVGLYGDAHTWWAQAEGRYERGHRPRVGAVMAFTPHGGMRLGHVAVVRRLVGAREVRLDHSNWSPINGQRGQIERDVRAVDVSPAGDWSQVHVWFGPIAALGGTAWPVAGFIYPAGGDPKARIALSERAERTVRERLAKGGGKPGALVGAEPIRTAAVPPPRRSGALGRLLAWRAGAAVRSSDADEKIAVRDSRRSPSRPAVARLASAVAAVAPRGARRAPASPQATATPTETVPEDLLALVEPARR